MSRQYTLHAARSTSIHIDYAAELNEQQFAAVTAQPGPQLIIAGAGSGKTRTLTYRVAYLLENGIDPRNILLLTFTNKAARQMLDRVANLLPADASGLWGGTFHSVGNRMLRRHGSALGYSSGFTIMDREDQKDLLNSVVASAGIDPREMRFPKGDVLADIFSFVVNTERPIEELLAAEHQNAMVVGDDAQSTYSWCGANFQNILAFPRRYPHAQVFKIELNYRSVPEILQVANAAISANVQQFRKNLSATRLTNSI